MTKQTCILAALTIAASAALQASPANYNLTFTLTNGTLAPTAGSFTYDSALASNPFSIFTVTEDGFVFDLTSAVNAFTGGPSFDTCKDSLTPSGFFHALTTSGCLNSWRYTQSQPAPPQQTFSISVCSLSGFACDAGSASATVSGSSSVTSHPAGLVTATATPEPSALWLSGIGLLSLLSKFRARRSLTEKRIHD